MEHWQWFTALYVLMSMIFLYFEYHTQSRMVKLFFKCFPLIMLIVSVTKTLVDASAPASPAVPGSVSKLSRLFWGLLFSCIGDAYLVFPDYFLLGVIAFAISQTIYISVFGGGFDLFQNSTNTEVIIGLVVVAISAVVYISIVSNMKPVLSVITALYCTLISTMLWSALIQAHRSYTLRTGMGAAGAAMFYTSDLMLSVNKWGIKLPKAQILVMTTYYSAQILITGSVLGID